MEDLVRYPIGKFSGKDSYTKEEINQSINRIELLPQKVEDAVHRLNDSQLDTRYREGGWTVRQLLHHIPDSHLNAYIRTKWTLTENAPTIKVYNEKLWAETPETKADPQLSITLLKALHAKWVVLLNQLTESDLQKHFVHPDTGKSIKLSQLISLYAWHGEHHLAHITALKERMKW